MYSYFSYPGNINSPKNQAIKKAFIERETGACITSIVDYVLGLDGEVSKPMFTRADIQNRFKQVVKDDQYRYIITTDERTERGSIKNFAATMYRLKPDGSQEEVFSVNTADAFFLDDNNTDPTRGDHVLTHFGDADDNLNIYPVLSTVLDEDEEPETEDGEEQETVIWWIVSPTLARLLIGVGEPVLDIGETMVWGNASTGALYDDSAINEICFELELLEGMKHE